eukprot:GHVL01041905.1.p1 GENE.GHVL01041905.1~~GHVL01041905.1.p1  ORF type:complete len:969 (-),score=130.10 GHVL01041905.1:1082-3988(-)
MTEDASKTKVTDEFSRNSTTADQTLEEIERLPIGLGWRKFYYFFHHAFKEVSSRKISYVFAFLSCLLVILISGIGESAVYSANAVFLKQTESENGEIDYTIVPDQYDGTVWNRRSIDRSKPFIEFPKLDKLLKAGGIEKAAHRHVIRYARLYTGCNIQDNLFDVRMSDRCNLDIQTFEIIVINTKLEEECEIGRTWPFQPLSKNGALLSTHSSRINVGDEIILAFHAVDLFTSIVAINNGSKEDLYTIKTFPEVRVPLYIEGFVNEGAYGKLSSTDSENVIFMESDTFLSLVGRYLAPEVQRTQPNVVDMILRTHIREFSTHVHISYPGNRIVPYLKNDYDSIHWDISEFAEKITKIIAFLPLRITAPILDGLKSYRYGSLFLSLILNLSIFILFLLSIILIYSLLLISVETKTFEMGILRMIGLNRLGLIQLLLVQSSLFVIPALIIGLLGSIGLNVVVNNFFRNSTNIPIENRPSWQGYILALCVGLLMPIFSSIYPITAALKSQIRDALDVHRPKAKVVAVTIERASERPISAALLVGSIIMSVYGFSIYYLVPLALFTNNLTLFFYIFLIIIISFLIGLVFLSLNIEPFLEYAFVYLLYFWESCAIRNLVLNNLAAHRRRNQKTTVMYSISLGFIIFLMTSYDLQVQSGRIETLRRQGSKLTLSFASSYTALVTQLERDKEFVQDWTIFTDSIDDQPSSATSVSLIVFNIGRLFSYPCFPRGVPPNFYETTERRFLRIRHKLNKKSALSLGEQLYTVAGSQKAIVGSAYDNFLHIIDNPKNNGTIEISESLESPNSLRIKPVTFLDLSPVLTHSPYPTETRQNIAVSIPTFMQLRRQFNPPTRPVSVRGLAMQRVIVKLKPGLTEGQRLQVVNNLRPLGTVWDYEEKAGESEDSTRFVTYIFYGAAIVVMIICLFSLVASMMANIFEQIREICVLRAIGLTRFQVFRVYMHEATILVISASVLG